SATANLAQRWPRAGELGLMHTPQIVDLATVSDSVKRVIDRLAPHDSVERFEALGVTVLRAEARFVDPRTVRAGATEIRARRYVIAAGSSPAVPAIPGLDAVPY